MGPFCRGHGEAKQRQFAEELICFLKDSVAEKDGFSRRRERNRSTKSPEALKVEESLSEMGFKTHMVRHSASSDRFSWCK